MIHLPEAFCERMRGLLGDQYGEFIASYDRDRVQGLRLNGLKTAGPESSPRDLARKIEQEAGFELQPIPWVRDGFITGRRTGPENILTTRPEHIIFRSPAPWLWWS